jgi:hypothetical protein
VKKSKGLTIMKTKIMRNGSCEIFMNETKFEDDVIEEIEKTPTLHIKTSAIMKILELLHS